LHPGTALAQRGETLAMKDLAEPVVNQLGIGDGDFAQEALRLWRT